MGDVMIAYPNTRPMCSANCDGAAAAVVVSRRQAQDALARAAAPGGEGVGVGPHHRPVARRRCQVLPDVNTLTRNAATQAYEQAGVGPEDLDLVELHDCFATAELVHYDNLMLCEEGGAVDFFESGATWRDGSTPGQRVGRPRVQGPPDRGHRHRQHLGGLPPPPRRGRRPPDRGRQGRPGPRHRPRLGLRRPHPREGGLAPTYWRMPLIVVPLGAPRALRFARTVRMAIQPLPSRLPELVPAGAGGAVHRRARRGRRRAHPLPGLGRAGPAGAGVRARRRRPRPLVDPRRRPFAGEFRVRGDRPVGPRRQRPPRRYALEQWTDEVMAVAEAGGIDGPPVVIGHSMGGLRHASPPPPATPTASPGSSSATRR